ncbi:MAG: formate dehydrogenase accessory protein FdhE [Deltaproteobacteria bacterium]|nr:formate dehydrogenase accessory protein FdhE [Deltaproteobacteria bacterium]
MVTMLKESLKTIEKYKSSIPHYGELLDILGEILILREEYKKRMQENIFPVNETLLKKKLEGGLPLIDFSTGQFDLKEPKQYFLALLTIAEKRAPGETEELMQKVKDGTLNFDKMVCDTFSAHGEDHLDDVGENEIDLVDLFLEESLRPAMEKVVERYGKIVADSGWTEGYCPICGKEPKIGEIREEEGKRFLFCNQCGFEWRFRRVKCPFCGNEEQQSLAYFTVEGDEKYRVDVCNECKRYIKMVDFRNQSEHANLDVEDIATLHLDMLANEEGYN